jgi:hypothetical protein
MREGPTPVDPHTSERIRVPLRQRDRTASGVPLGGRSVRPEHAVSRPAAAPP